MRLGIIAALAFVASILLGSSPSKADFHVCNFTGSPTEVAFGYYEPQDGWTSRGWFKLQLGECKVALRGALQTGTYYVYGHSDDGRAFAGPSSQTGGFFCTQKPKFELHTTAYTNGQTLNCEASGLKAVRFLAVSVASPDYTYRISPSMDQIGTALAPLGSLIQGLQTPPASNTSTSGNTSATAAQPNLSPPPVRPAPVTSSSTVVQPAPPSPPPGSARPAGGSLSSSSGPVPSGSACQRFPNLC